MNDDEWPEQGPGHSIPMGVKERTSVPCMSGIRTVSGAARLSELVRLMTGPPEQDLPG